MRPTAFVLFLLSIGCGSGAPAPSPSNEVEPESTGGLRPDDEGAEIDPQVCASDADCMVGTPRDCCTSFCPEDAVAWSHAAWAAYQAECAVEECTESESLACRDEFARSFTAVCRAERCVLE